jgi:hypothetical protein
VLLTRTVNYRDGVPSWLEQHVFDRRCAHGNAQLMNAFCSTYTRENAVRDIALGRQTLPDGINIATLCPDEHDPRVERMTRNTEILKGAAVASAKRTMAAFGHIVEDFVEVLRPLPAVAHQVEAAETAPSEPDDPSLAAA